MFVHELGSAMYGSKGAGGTGSYMYMVASLTHARSIVLGGKAKDSKKKRTFSFAHLDHLRLFCFYKCTTQRQERIPTTTYSR